MNCFLPVPALLFFFAAGTAAAITPADLAGVWVFDSLEADGTAVTDENVLAGELEIKAATYTFHTTDFTARGKVILDSSTTPAHLDLEETEGNNVGTTARGIVELTSSGGWRYAVDLQGTARPDKFVSDGTDHLLAVYKRKVVTARPLRGLLVTGGCCHDFPAQAEILTKGLSKRVNIQWTVATDPDASGPQHHLSVYESANWAAKYDVVVHNECYSDEKDPEWLERIVQAHRAGVPAVVIHCTIHSYRAPTNEWFKFIGVTSHGRGSHFDYLMTNTAPAHPIMLAFPAAWHTPKDELYSVASLEPTATPLATGWNPETKRAEVNAWVNTYGKARVFGTSVGHYNQTLQEPIFLDLVARGLLWTCGKLKDDGTPVEGYAGK